MKNIFILIMVVSFGCTSSHQVRQIPENATDPLVVVNGVPKFQYPYNEFSPYDIISVTYVKYEDAKFIFGSLAKNGVVLIITSNKKSKHETKRSLRHYSFTH